MTPTTESTESSLILSLECAAGSDIGMRREENQDSYGIIEGAGFRTFIVADGMGGVKGGAIASQTAVQVITKELLSNSEIGEDLIVQAVDAANREIFDKGTQDTGLAGMGTTLVGITFVQNGMLLTNVGDSRAYRFRQNKVKQLTTDHTLVMELVRSGAITPDQAENHPVSHMLTRSLGPTPSIDVDCWLYSHGPSRGDIYLLCSDGLYNLVHESDLVEILSSNSLEDSVKKLIQRANERGGTDNITVVLIKIGDVYGVGPEAFSDEDEGVLDTVELDYRQKDVPDSLHQFSSHESNGSSNGASSTTDHLGSPKLEARMSMGAFMSGVHAQVHGPKRQTVSDEHIARAVTEKLEAPKGWNSYLKNRKFLEGVLFTAAMFSVILACWKYLISQDVGTFSGANMARNGVAGTSKEVSAPMIFPAQIAEVPLRDEGKQFIGEPTLPALTPVRFDDSSNSGVGQTEDSSHNLSKDELENVQRRRAELKNLIEELGKRSKLIEKGSGEDTNAGLHAASDDIARIRKEVDDTKAELDVATRKLSIWFGRGKRLESTDPIDLAKEVAVSSASVKEKQEIFEKATWEYLKAFEVLRYNPSDQKQEDLVENLARLRKSRMKDLTEEVRSTIDNERAEADKKIAELSARREQLEANLENAKSNLEYYQVLAGGDAAAKAAKKEEIEKEMAKSTAELTELDQLLPAPQN